MEILFLYPAWSCAIAGEWEGGGGERERQKLQLPKQMSDTFIIQLYSYVEILVRFARFGKRRARVAVSNSEGCGENRSSTNTGDYQHRIDGSSFATNCSTCLLN